MSKRNDKMSKSEKLIVAFIAALVALTFVIAYNAEPSEGPKHGSYAKCDQYGVKGCVRWSVVTY